MRVKSEGLCSITAAAENTRPCALYSITATAAAKPPVCVMEIMTL